MKIEVRIADTQNEAPDLASLDKKIFLPSDCFEDPDTWKEYLAFWIIVDGEKVGSIALGLNLKFSGSWKVDKPSLGSIYLASTGILPKFQRRGIGNFVKQWEINWATNHGFTSISTHCRKSNAGSLRLNTKFGFKVVGEVPDYYNDPDEPTIVMELIL